MNPMTTVVVVARVLAVWLLVSKSSAETVEYDFIVARENLALDGVLKKGVITVNGRTPGPEIRVRPGDELVVNVKNLNVENGTSIHWHGQHLRDGDLYNDGVPFVTQCVIDIGQTYTYRFNVNDSPGSYFYHGHQMSQRGDGLAGPLIIESTEENAKDATWDKEFNVVIQDWYQEHGDVLVDWLDSVPFIWVGDPQSILINGQGMFNSSVGSNAVFQVTGGETVLLRLVNAGLLSYLNVEITGHTMTVIEADGQPIEPLTVSNLDVNIAERYNVLVRMDQPVANYNITVSTKYRSLRVGTALLSYDGAEDIAEPVEVESALEPEILDPAAIMGISELPGDMADFDAELTINGTQELNEISQLRWPLNRRTPNSKWLSARTSLIPEGENPNTWVYPFGTVLDIVLQNFPAGNGVVEQHPWHLHGHSFYVLGWGPGQFDRKEHQELLNLKNPPLRDMVTLFPDGNNSWVAPSYAGQGAIRPSGWTVVRVKLDNPGIWMLHCHIAWHLAMDMFGFIVTEPAANSIVLEPPNGFPQCLNEREEGSGADDMGDSGNTANRLARFASVMLAAMAAAFLHAYA